MTTKRTRDLAICSRAKPGGCSRRNYERVLDEPGDVEARGAMLLGAHYAGVAIEQSMLGATHACANPLTARYGTTHGVAIAVMLPHVVRWNAEVVGDRYAELLPGQGPRPATARASWRAAGGLPRTLTRARRVRARTSPRSPRTRRRSGPARLIRAPFDATAARRLYERAL